MNIIYCRSGIRALGVFLLRPRPGFSRVLGLTLFFIAVLLQGYAQVPAITGLSPSLGPVGTPVTISGSNFSATAADNTVYFGPVKATVTAASASALTVTVPSGATEQPVSVTVSGLTFVSNLVFHVTFSNGVIDASSIGTSLDLNGGQEVRIADVDGDGKPDVVSTDIYTNTLSIYRKVGTGKIVAASFATKVTLAATADSEPRDLVVGDLNGDGKPDLALYSMQKSTISVFKNTSSPGAVSFDARIDIPTLPAPRGLGLGDLDGDGKPELVTVGQYSKVYIHKNLSTAGAIDVSTFATYTQFMASETMDRVMVDDVDDDGKPDLILTSAGVYVMRNSYTGSAFSFDAQVSVMDGASKVMLTDLDGDGLRDMVTAHGTLGGFYIARNTSTSGLLVAFEPQVQFVTGLENLACVAAGDFNGDGKPDLALGSEANRLMIFQNQASSGVLDASSLAAGVEYVLGFPNMGAGSMEVGDLNADGKPDVVIGGVFGGGRVLVKENGVVPVPPTPQTISFDSFHNPQQYDAWFQLVAVASSGLDVVFSSSNTSVVTVDGGYAHVVGLGSAVITARQPGNIVYAAAPPKSRAVTTVKADQYLYNTMAFPTVNFVGAPPIAIDTKASTGLPMTFGSTNTAVATISGNMVNLVGAGTTTITYQQLGNEFYNPSRLQTQDLVVSKGTQTIIFGPIATKSVADADFAPEATASSGLDVSYTSSNTDVAVVSGNMIQIVGVGTSTITASQDGNANYNAATPKTQELTVVKVDQTITFGTIAVKVVDDADFAPGATASSGLEVSYSSGNTSVATISGSNVHIVGPGVTDITASQPGNPVFAAALPVTRILEVEAIMSTGREASSAMSIYPNPVADRMTIAASRFNRQSSVQVALVDAYGREVVCEALWVNDDHKIDLSVSLLTDGVYILHVKQGAIEFRSRIVKIR